jgi:hypothetical protein
MHLSKNGIPFVTEKLLSKMLRGWSTCQCPPSVKTAPYREERSKSDVRTLSPP